MTHSLAWKFDKSRLDAICDLDKVVGEFDINYLLIGAIARDLLDQLNGTIGTRLTEDVDFAINIPTWDDFEKLSKTLLETLKFRRQEDKRCRFYHIPTNVPIDILPFGQIDQPDYVISWPPDKDFGMSTLGFREAYNGSIEIHLSENPILNIRIPSGAGLAILKLIAWNENPARRKDAPDILHLIRNYLNSNNDSRLYDEDSDLVESADFDYECAGARLLGRDMASIASPQTLKTIADILNIETSDDSDSRLIFNMIGVGIGAEFGFEQVLQLLRCLLDGIRDGNKR